MAIIPTTGRILKSPSSSAPSGSTASSPNSNLQSVLQKTGVSNLSGYNVDVLNRIADQNAKASSSTSSTTSSTPAGSNYSTSEQGAQTYLNNFQQPETSDQIQQRMIQQAQGQINSINEYGNQLLADQKIVNDQRSRATQSVNTLTGLAGSTEANTAVAATDNTNNQANAKIRAETNNKVQTLLSEIRKTAEEQATAQRTEARLSADTILKNRTQRITEATDNAKLLAASGATAEGYAKTDPQGYAYLAQQVGGEQALKALFTLNRPQEQVLDKRVEGGKYVIAYQNPIDGKVRIESVDLGLPQGTIQVADAGGYILFGQAGPDGKWDGNMETTMKIAKTPTPKAPGEGSGVSNTTIDNERSLMSQFRGEKIVQDYNLVSSQKSAMDNYIANGVGGPADLAMVFSFMKGLDPNSVVRETEYDTAAKSGNIFQGQWAKFNGYFKENGGFLPENVKNEFQNLVNQKYKAQQKLYDNVAKQYTDIATRQGLNPQNVVIDYANGMESQDDKAANDAPVGSVVTLYGRQFKKTGQGTFDEILSPGSAALRDHILGL